MSELTSFFYFTCFFIFGEVQKVIRKAGKSIISSIPFLKYKKGNRLIFYYHDLSEKSAAHFSTVYSTEPEEFEKHIAFYKNNFALVSLDEIVSDKLQKDKNYVSITFDDSFLSVREIAYPILKKEGIPFSVFLNKRAITKNRLWTSDLVLATKNRESLELIYKEVIKNAGRVSLDAFIKNPFIHLSDQFLMNYIGLIEEIELSGRQKIYMDENDIRFLSENGVIIGNHTVSHFDLSRCNKNILESEIKDNSGFLKEITGRNPIHFAIPFGKRAHYNPLVLQVAGEAGLEYVYTSNPSPIKENFILRSPKLIPRIGITTESIREIAFYINRSFIRKYDL